MCQSSPVATIVPIYHQMFNDECFNLFKNAAAELFFQSEHQIDRIGLFDFERNFIKPVMKHECDMYVLTEMVSSATTYFDIPQSNDPIEYNGLLYAIHFIFVGTFQTDGTFRVKRLMRFTKDFVPYMEVDHKPCVPLDENSLCTNDERVFWKAYFERYKKIDRYNSCLT